MWDPPCRALAGAGAPDAPVVALVTLVDGPPAEDVMNLYNRDSESLDHFKDTFRFMNLNQIHLTLALTD